jgi:putative transposase
MIRLVVLLGYATAALTGLAFGPYQGKDTGEPSLFRPLLADLVPGDIVVADRYSCTYWLVALALARGVDVTFRLHHGRKYDFRRGRRLGPDDHVVSWRRPARPDWMDAATYATMPAAVTVRELRVRVTTSGFRPEELILATTLTEAAAYAYEDIADLYHQRWLAELDIRAIKSSLRMEHLRCRTPAMMEKELWVHFLAYNLVRKVSAQAALTQGIRPREVSFTGTRDAVAAFWSQLTVAGTAAERLRHGRAVLQTLGTEKVGQRPDRYEPRLVKRRAKPYKLLQKPRAEARADLLRQPHR